MCIGHKMVHLVAINWVDVVCGHWQVSDYASDFVHIWKKPDCGVKIYDSVFWLFFFFLFTLPKLFHPKARNQDCFNELAAISIFLHNKDNDIQTTAPPNIFFCWKIKN